MFGVVGALLVIALVLCGVFAVIMVASSAATALATFFFAVCLFMMLVILIQRPKGGGLAGAFGGVGGGQQTAFGAKVGDVLTWVTVGLFVAFLFFAMGLTWHIKSEQEGLQQGATLNASESEGGAGDVPVTPDIPVGEVPLPPETTGEQPVDTSPVQP